MKATAGSSAGQFDERVFAGLDFVLAEAGKRGLNLILALTNNWTPYGGMPQYVRFVQTCIVQLKKAQLC